MNLADILDKENVFIAESIGNTDRFYSSYTEFLANRGIIKNKKEVKRLFIKREHLQSTAIGKGAAAPHIFSAEFSQFLFSIAFIKNSVSTVCRAGYFHCPRNRHRTVRTQGLLLFQTIASSTPCKALHQRLCRLR